MAPLIANRNTTSQSTRPPALPSNFRMPHVFVIPPEEEQQDNPPWCCFDADEQPENDGAPLNPDIRFLDVPYLFHPPKHPLLLSRRTSVHQPRLRLPMSKKLEKKQRPEALQIIESRSFQARRRDSREDSDVIEVVKVKRGRESLMDLEENTQVKRSKTLRVRATKALQSIKNVGKASQRTHVKELWTSSESTPGVFKGVQEQIRSQQEIADHCPRPTLPKKGSLSRSSSRSLSQIFQPMKSSRVESTFTVCVPSSVAPAEARHISPVANPSSLSRLRSNNTSSPGKVPNTLTTDDALNKPVSPIRTTKKRVNTKFSVRELHRLFSFSPSSPDSPSPPPAAMAAPFSSTLSESRPSTSTSMFSWDHPDVPMEEDTHGDARLSDPENADRKLASRYHQALHAHHDDDSFTQPHLSDTNFEMRLDSLHFDALSFDPEDFDVSRDGDILR